MRSNLGGGGKGPKQVGTMSQLYPDLGFEGFPYINLMNFHVLKVTVIE